MTAEEIAETADRINAELDAEVARLNAQAYALAESIAKQEHELVQLFKGVVAREEGVTAREEQMRTTLDARLEQVNKREADLQRREGALQYDLTTLESRRLQLATDERIFRGAQAPVNQSKEGR